MIEKKCTKCNEVKLLVLFYKDKGTKTGYGSRCKDCVKKCSKESQEKNKEYRKEYLKEYCINNKERLFNNKKIYIVKWKEKNKGYINNYNIERRKKDELYRIKHNLRNRMNLAFKKNKWIKDGGSEMLLGASIDIVKKHIENNFTKGMSWDNYGLWHIDHIKPLDSGKSKNDLIELCNYKNLQPLWAIDNIKKGNKL